ncbi:substrate-binding domain-containing protein [Brevundimonas sp. Root1279]|uniref:substrate-binding domain-containing protein n=1 Tax=Brevundimonas sp. Root1279 TaxID=1736443 RepID=UPI0006F7A4F5|nr:substrate-binding domain-containing protein [Brevundimonas sp. Root1279]KQW82387.1 sugar ABC transporter substrate-binding protein [Brevundimonas sp. Root1279]
MVCLSRRRLVAAVSVAPLLGLAGCSRGGGRDRIAVSFHNMAEPFFVVMRRELMDEAAKLDVDVVVLDGQANSAKQSADIEAALVQGVKGVILAPTDVNALAPAVNSILKESLPVITVDRRIEGTTAPVPHVGADNVAGGRMMVEWIVRTYPQGARIVLLTGQPGSSSAIDRTRGVSEALTQAGGRYSIVAEQSANWSRDQGLTVTQNILTALGATKPDVILAENDDMAFGAIEALRTAGVSGVSVLGFDATPEALSRIKAGTMALSVEQSPSRQIRSALQQVVAAVRQNSPLASVNIAPVIITRETLSSAERLSEAT